jgi:putative membrane protein
MKRTALLLGAALVCLAPMTAVERTSIAQAQTAVSGEEFVKTAGVANMFEVESSRIAAEKSKKADVKSFADRMIADHTKAGEELKKTAKAADAKYVVPDKLDAKHQQALDELKAAAEAKFDATYVKMQTDAHKDAVDLFGAYAKQGDNPALREFASKTLPTLQHHYDMIKQIGTSQNLAQTKQSSDGQGQATTQPGTDQNQAQTTIQSTTEQNQAQTTTQPATEGLTVRGLEAGNLFVASTVMGSTLYSTANEDVGDVNDIVIDKNGDVKGVVVGVGGFLGLGEKDVVVPMDRIQFGRDENNNMKLTITASRQELEQAPAFDRTPWRTGGGTTGGGTTTTVQ